MHAGKRVAATAREGFHGIERLDVATFSRLATLSLRRTNLEGEIPASCSELAHLKLFDVTDNRLGGALPHGVGVLKARGCDVRLNGNRGFTLPACEDAANDKIVKDVNSITSLDFSRACLKGRLTDAFGKCPCLTELHLGGNKLKGPRVLEAFQALKPVGSRLVRLSLAGNALGGMLGGVNKVLNDAMREHIDNLPPTEKCTMMTLPKELFQTDAQKEAGALRFAKNKKKKIQDRLSGKVASDDADDAKAGKREPGQKSTTAEIFAEFSNLTSLALWGMDLEGVIHEDFSRNLTNLRQLWLSNNHIGGELPASFSALTGLELFDASDNALSGPTLPQAVGLLGRCARLRTLNLSGNPLGGEFTEQLCSFTALEELKLNDMRLEGVIPNDVARLARLRVLFVFNNRLSGSLPPRWARSPSCASST